MESWWCRYGDGKPKGEDLDLVVMNCSGPKLGGLVQYIEKERHPSPTIELLRRNLVTDVTRLDSHTEYPNLVSRQLQ